MKCFIVTNTGFEILIINSLDSSVRVVKVIVLTRTLPYSDFVGTPGEPLPVTSEEDIFDYLGMEFKQPNQRNS